MLDAIDVRDLVGDPGSSRQQPVVGMVEDLATELVRVPDDAPIRADLLLESVVEGIFVSGRVEGRWTLRCARCLAEFEQPFHLDLDEPEGLLEPEQMIRDVIGVEMPFSPLCRSDCQGLCATCGGNRNFGECPGHAEFDQRFAVLADLFPDLPNLD
jgi:uncharacterized protein